MYRSEVLENDMYIFNLLLCFNILFFVSKLYWSVTHAYIQESIFDVIVSKLLDYSQRSQHLEFINCGQHNQLNVILIRLSVISKKSYVNRSFLTRTIYYCR